MGCVDDMTNERKKERAGERRGERAKKEGKPLVVPLWQRSEREKERKRTKKNLSLQVKNPSCTLSDQARSEAQPRKRIIFFVSTSCHKATRFTSTHIFSINHPPAFPALLHSVIHCIQG